jgi:hypothetical protein
MSAASNPVIHRIGRAVPTEHRQTSSAQVEGTRLVRDWRTTREMFRCWTRIWIAGSPAFKAVGCLGQVPPRVDGSAAGALPMPTRDRRRSYRLGGHFKHKRLVRVGEVSSSSSPSLRERQGDMSSWK